MPSATPVQAEETLGTIDVQEIRSDHPAEWHLVRDFYQLWSGDKFTNPSLRELTVARDLLERYGRTKLHALLPLTVKRVKEQWPEAKTFGAIAKYVPEVHEEYESRHRLAEREKEEHLRQQMEEEKLKQERKVQNEIVAQYRDGWTALPQEERTVIEQETRRQWPYVARVPAMFERYCIIEYARRYPHTEEEPVAVSSVTSDAG